MGFAVRVGTVLAHQLVMSRTDPHRPGAIIPADYEPWQCYSLPTSCGGWPLPSIGLDCVHDRAARDPKTLATITPGAHDPEGRGRCCVSEIRRVAAEQGVTIYGNAGKCGSCGAHFVYGEVWRHTPTGDFVHLGHDCADKYNLMMDRSQWLKENNKLREAAAVHIARNAKATRRQKFLDAHVGLEQALATDHRIIRDISDRLTQWGTLSDAQIALVMRLHAESLAPKVEETHVPAPTGRVEFEGEIISIKATDGHYGPGYRMTVKVQAEGGTWLANGTCPVGLGPTSELRGKRVNVIATLTPSGDKEHFVFMKRPIARLVGEPPMPRGCAIMHTFKDDGHQITDLTTGHVTRLKS